MLYFYNQSEKMGLRYKESKGKGSLQLMIGEEPIVIGTTKEPEIKNLLMNKSADKKDITTRLKRIFLSIKSKRLILDLVTNEFRFIGEEETNFKFAQNIIYLICKGKVGIHTTEMDFVSCESQYLEKSDVTLFTLIPRWRVWSAMKHPVYIDIKNDKNEVINSFELGYMTDASGNKSNSLRYKDVEKKKKPQKKTTPTKSAKPAVKKEKIKEVIDVEHSTSKYPAKKKKIKTDK